MGDFFNVTITGEETITNDVNDFIAGLRNPIWEGLSAVADGMTANLQVRIQEDVYDAYEPKSYPRRSSASGVRFGRSLIDKKNMVVSFPNSMSMSFSYEPTGYHSGKMQDALDAYSERNNPTQRTKSHFNEPLKPHPVHGDALIRRIQSGEGYDWKPPVALGEFPKRPFWDNFVEAQKNGLIIENFAYGFSRNVSDFRLEGGSKDLEWKPTEGMLEYNVWDEDFDPDLELPY